MEEKVIDYDERASEYIEAVKKGNPEPTWGLVHTAYVAGGLDAGGQDIKYGDRQTMLKAEQKMLKERLVRLIGFINSEEYFTLDETEKSLLMSQRAGMEIYLNSLTQRIYGARKVDVASGMLPLMLLSMFNPFPSSSPSADYLKEQLAKNENQEGTTEIRDTDSP